jgi:hypothetical protein
VRSRHAGCSYLQNNKSRPRKLEALTPLKTEKFLIRREEKRREEKRREEKRREEKRSK